MSLDPAVFGRRAGSAAARPGRKVSRSPVLASNREPRSISRDTVPLELGGAEGEPATHAAGGSRSRALLAEAGVIAAAAAVLFMHLRDGFFVGDDDLLQLSVADTAGLSWELLSLNVFGHFGPVNRLGHLLFLRWGDLDLTVGAIAVTALTVLLLATVLWCCRELHLPPIRRVLVLAFTGFSVAVLDSAVWLDAALHIFPALIATYAVLAAHLRGINTGAARWHVLSLAFLAGGMLTQERPVFAVPLVVLVDVLLVTAGRPWRERVALLWSVRFPLAGMTVIAGAAAVLLKLYYVAPGGQGPPLDVLARTFAGALTSAWFPALLGWVPEGLPSPLAQGAIALIMVAVAGLVVLQRRSNGGPVVFALATFSLYYGFLAFSPLLNADSIEYTALRMHNAVYVVVPNLIALAHLRFSAGGDERSGWVGTRPSRLPGWVRWVRRAAPVALTVLFLTVTGSVFTTQHWDRARGVHAYLENLAAAQDDWARPDTTVLPLYSPEPVARGWSEELGRHESLLGMIRPGWSPGPLGDRPVVLDDQGRVRPVALQEEARGWHASGADARGCLSPTGDRMTFALDRPVALSRTGPGSPTFIAVSYQLTQAAAPVVATRALALGAQSDQWAYNSWPVTLPVGRHTVLVPLLADFTVRDVGLAELTPGIPLCVTGVRVVQPVYDTGDVCFELDRHGVRGAQVRCPDKPGSP